MAWLKKNWWILLTIFVCLSLISGSVGIWVSDKQPVQEISIGNDTFIPGAFFQPLADAPSNTVWILSSTVPAQIRAAAIQAKQTYGSRIQLCDGINDQVQIQAGIDVAEALGGGTVLFSDGTFTVADAGGGFAFNIASSNVDLIGSANTVIDGTAMGAGDHILEAVGTTGNVLVLSAQADRGANTLTVAAGGGVYSANDLVLVYSTTIWHGNSHNQKSGEFQWVASGADALITFYHQAFLRDTYTLAGTASVAKVNYYDNILVRGIKFIGDGATDVAGVYAEYCVNFRVEDCVFEDVDAQAIYFTSCLGGGAFGNTVHRTDLTGYGYGVCAEYACEGITVSNNSFLACRHAFTLGGGASGFGIPRSLVVSNNYVTDCTAAGLDTHNVGESITISHNTIKGCYYGINFYSWSGLIDGNTIQDTDRDGIRILDCEGGVTVSNNVILYPDLTGMFVHTGAKNVKIIGNTFYHTQDWGLYMEDVTECQVIDNTFIGSYEKAIILEKSATGTDNILIQGNTIRRDGLAGTIGIDINNVACTDTVIINNDLRDAGTTIIQDSGVGTIIRGNEGYIATGEARSFNTSDFAVSALGDVTLDRNRNIMLPAAGGTPTTTSGCSDPTQVEYGTNDVDVWFLDFDSTSDEYAFWSDIPLPDEFGADGTTMMTAIFYWTCTGGTGAATWGIQARAYADSDAIDQAWGTAVWINDSIATADDVTITATTAAMTLAGTPAAGNMACFRIIRDADNSEALGDTLAFDARLMAVKLVWHGK